MSEIARSVAAKLTAALLPQSLTIEDETALHAGHAGARAGGGHLKVSIVSERFGGLTPVERHRLVYGVLSNEMGTRIHALALETLTPEEAGARGE